MQQVRFDVSEDLAVIGNCYSDPNIDGKNQKTYIEFLDNAMYLKYLTCIPIAFKDENGNKTVTRKAYEWQLEKIKGVVSVEKYTYYEQLFRSWHIEIENMGKN